MSEDVRTPETGLPPAQNDSPSSRMRSRLGRFGARSGAAFPAIEPVLQAARTNHPKADLAVVEQAYVVAEKAHRGQLRKSGDPYITHPVAVATILAELGMTPSTLAAALLHDTVEDTDYSLDQLRREFGAEIAMLVDGVTKLDKVTYGDAAQAETVRKMVVAMSRDIRVLVIKLADRLHNARTWKFVAAASAEKKARETLEIYAPLAHRLGMNTIKWELEDLSFATLYPKVYDEIVHLVAERAPAREEYLATVREQVGADLRQGQDQGATVTGRPKHYYSIYQKMIVRGRDFADIYDLVGVRVLVDSVRDCYAALGALHARWNPVPGRFKDYIAMPKFNMYQSLHTTVIGPGGKPVEIQIRTHDMHRRAEYGVAAHWKYKESAKNARDDGQGLRRQRHAVAAAAGRLAEGDRRPERVPRLAAVRDRRLRGLRLHPEGRRDRRCRPARRPSTSRTPCTPRWATARMGARVNGRLVPLDSSLENGDVVDVFTSKSETAGPSPRLARLRQEPARAQQDPPVVLQGAPRGGRSSTARTPSPRRCASRTCRSSACCRTSRSSALANEMRYADVSALYAAIGEGQVSAGTVVQRLVQSMGGEPAAEEDLAEVARPGPDAAAGPHRATPASWSRVSTTSG